MNLHKQFHNEHVRKTALHKQYTNISSIRFSEIMESFIINKLINENFKKRETNQGIIWDNKLDNNGIIVETDVNPYVSKEYTLKITGTKDHLDKVDYLLNINKTVYESSDPKQIYIKLEYHDTLNPVLWNKSKVDSNEYTIKTDVREALLDIVEAYLDYIDMPDMEIHDVTLTGSSCNYNWTNHSDIDLHIIVDFKEVEDVYGKLAVNYTTAQRKLWNSLHDINIKGIPVEVYVQDINEEHYSTGIFSLLTNEWIEKPERKRPSLEFNDVKTKASRLMDDIDVLLKSCSKPEPIQAMIDKIVKMRKAGLEEAGEWGVDNYVFKVLRTKGYIDKLNECRNKAIDTELSVEEEEMFRK